MINSFKNPAIMRILRTTERHGAGWREQNFIPCDETVTLGMIYDPETGTFSEYAPSEPEPIPEPQLTETEQAILDTAINVDYLVCMKELEI